MILVLSLAVAVLFGTGAYLLLQRNLIRVVAGIALISQSAVLTLIGASLSEGPAAIGVAPGAPVADPLPQALSLTALVIGLGTLALLLALVHRLVVAYGTVEREEMGGPDTAPERSGGAGDDRDDAA